MVIDEWIRQQLVGLNLGLSASSDAVMSHTAVLLVVCLLALLTNFIAKRIILSVVKRFIGRTAITWDDILVEHHVFDRLSQLAPALVFYAFSGVIFPAVEGLHEGIKRAAIAYMIVIVARAVDGLLSASIAIYNRFEVARARPIKSYVQVVKVIVVVVTAILVVSTLTQRSPWGFLSGLAGLTAVLMLVFKDSILGLVGSIQLTANDMVAVGDWIEVPKYNVDGAVIDISLNTIKVQNWDKTISSFPTYALMSDTFRNWQGMSESGGRRIKRALHLDMNTVRFLDPALLEQVSSFDLLKTYLADKRAQIAEDAKARGVDPAHRVNARQLTNLGTFRAYVFAYLRAHPKIHDDMTFLVRHLAPGPEGVPLEIYVFSNDQVWANYEALQADIFEHLLAVLPEFDLRPYQKPSGRDLRVLAADLRPN